MTKEGSDAVKEIYTGDEAKLETVMRRISVKPSTIQKMRKISALFSDEIGSDLKDPELIGAFLELSFQSFLKSGSVEKKLKEITGE